MRRRSYPAKQSKCSVRHWKCRLLEQPGGTLMLHLPTGPHGHLHLRCLCSVRLTHLPCILDFHETQCPFRSGPAASEGRIFRSGPSVKQHLGRPRGSRVSFVMISVNGRMSQQLPRLRLVS